MDLDAIRTIRIQNFKASKTKAMKMIKSFLATLTTKYPMGLEDGTENSYFVMPGYGHVTKYQPIAVFNGIDAEWQISTTTLFTQPN